MRYLIILSLLVFSSCGKDEDPKFCFECVEFTVTTSPTGYYNEETVTTEQCNKTDAEADAIEMDGTTQFNEGPNTIVKTTTCTKKD